MRLSELPILGKLVRFTQRSSLPGFGGVPIYNVGQFVWNEAIKEDNDIVTRSNSIAFNFFLSLFPLMIFLFTLLPLLPFTADYVDLFRQSTTDLLPKEAHQYLFGIIDGVASIPRSGLLSVGFIFAIFFSSSGMVTLMYGFHKSYDQVFKKRSYIKNRLVAIGLTLLIALLFLISMFMIIFGKPILSVAIDKLNMSSHATFVFTCTKWLIVVFVIYFGISLIYRYGSAMKKRIGWINTGALLATILSIISSVAFSFFINSFGRYNEFYGSIGALLVLMLWIQINVFIVLVGFEFNASIAVNRAAVLNREK